MLTTIRPNHAPKRSGSRSSGQVAPRPQEDLLGGVARVGLVAKDRQRRAERGGQPRIHEDRERVVVTPTGAFHEGRFGPRDRRCRQDVVHARVVPRAAVLQRMTPVRWRWLVPGHGTGNWYAPQPMKIGLQISSFTWPGGTPAIGPTLAEIVRQADDVGFASSG